MKLETTKTIELPTTVHDVSLAANEDSMLWAACLDGGIHGVSLDSGDHFLLGRHRRYASGVHALPDGETVISAGYDGRLHWHDVKSRTCFREIQAHRFWSWQSALSPNGKWIASSTGQYLCGGYKYEPAPESEPSVKVYSTHTGDLVAAWSHVPPVQSVTFSRDGRYVAAGNLMGEVRVWEVESGKLQAQWATGDFTGWGIIKGHYYTGGVFSLAFGPGDDWIYLIGMGSTRDPAAGNGKQLWQAYRWRDGEVQKVSEAAGSDTGQGLMETLAFHPTDAWFLMAGRLESGQWNVGAFDRASGALQSSADFKGRICRALFLPGDEDERFLLAGGVSQGGPKEGRKFRDFGRIWLGTAGFKGDGAD